jgi:hypothetical protein
MNNIDKAGDALLGVVDAVRSIDETAKGYLDKLIEKYQDDPDYLKEVIKVLQSELGTVREENEKLKGLKDLVEETTSYLIRWDMMRARILEEQQDLIGTLKETIESFQN